MKPLLVLVEPRLGPTLARTTVRLSSGGSGAAAGLGGFNWESALVRRPRFTIELLSPDLDGRTQVGRGDFTINMGRVRQADAFNLYWPGAPVTVYDATSLDLTAAPIEFTGFVRSAPIDLETGQLTLNLEVNSQSLDKPVLTAEFTGGGGINGDPGFKGTLKPAGFGTVKNIEPVWFDAARNIGMVDGYSNTVSIDSLFEGSSAFGAKVADYADYATLAARIDDKTVAPGRWATCAAQGLVGLGAPPVAPITVDAVFGTNRPGALMRRLMETHAGIAVGSVDTAAFTALDTAVNRAVHCWVGGQRTVRDLVEAIAASCNATPLVTFQGKYSVTRAFGGANIATINKQAPVAAQRVTKWRALEPETPTWRMKMIAERVATVQSFDQILYADDIIDRGVFNAVTVYRQGNLVWNAAGAQYIFINATPAAGQALPVLPSTVNAYWERTKPAPAAGDLFYADGTSIQALKPAEAGADVTLTHTASAITGQAATATNSSFDAITGATRPANYSDVVTSFVFNGGEANLTRVGNRFTRTSGDGSSWLLGEVISTAVKGAQRFSFRAVSGAKIAASLYNGFNAGVNSHSHQIRTTAGDNSIDVHDIGGNFVAKIAPAGSFGANSVMAFDYDDVAVRFQLNGTTLYTWVIGAGATFNAHFHFMNVGHSVFDASHLPSAKTADINTNVVDSNGGAIQTVPRNEIKTPLGTAAAIAGQAATATNSDFAAVTGGTRPSDNATASEAVFSNGGATVRGNTVTATAAGAAWTLTPLVGSAFVGAQPDGSSAVDVGLALAASRDANVGSHDPTYFGIQAHTSNTYWLHNGVFGADGMGVHTPGDRYSITYDGRVARYYRNGGLLKTRDAVANLTLFPRLYFYGAGTAKEFAGGSLGQIPNVATNVYDGASLLSAAQLVTAQGTAAAIAGQGTLATLNAVNLDTHVTETATYKRLPTVMRDKVDGIEANATLGGRFDLNLYEPLGDGGAVATRIGYRTNLGTAAAITSQSAWATYAGPISSVIASQPNLFPYPRPVGDGRQPIDYGWQNTGAIGTGGSNGLVNGGQAAAFGGTYYATSRTNGAAGTFTPFFDFSFAQLGSQPVSISLSGYADNGTFSPYIDFLDAAGAGLGNGDLVSNTTSGRWERTLTAPAGTATIRVVARGIFAAAVNQGQGIYFYAIKVERAAAPTPYTELGGQLIEGGNIRYSTNVDLNALRPAELGSNVTETRTASGITGQGVLATRAWARFGLHVRRADDVTVVGDADAITNQGQAASIAGQGAFATLNDVDFEGARVTNKARVSRLNPTSGYAGSNFAANDGRSFSRIAAARASRDGDVVSFGATYDAVPKITFLPGGNAASGGQNIQIIASGLTVSGFTMKAKSQAVTAGATITDTAGVSPGAGEPTFIVNRSDGGTPFDGRFRFNVSVTVGTISSGEPGFIEVGAFVRQGGVWVQVGTGMATTTSTLVIDVYPGAVDFGAGGEFGVTRLAGEGGTTALNGLNSVVYTLGSVVETSLTPAGASDVPWLALLQ